MNFSDKLRELRKARDIKQEAFAEAMNVSRQTVSKWENGTAMPDLKKLTAIAKYFNVTVDELLGFGNATDERGEINDYTKEYINELITLENEECTRKINELNKKLKICVIILSAVLIFTTIITLNQNDKIDNLQNQINNVQNSQITTNDSDDNDTHTIEDDAGYEILSFDKDKPWLANVRFTYSPETYSNSLNVSVEIPQENGKSKSLELENKNGKFILETQIDATIKGNFTLIAKDDNNTSTTDVTPDFTGRYFNVDEYVSNIEYQNGKMAYKDDVNDNITFNMQTKATLKSGNLKIYEDNGTKPIYEKAYRINANNLVLGQFKFDYGYDFYDKNGSGCLTFEVSATDESGIKYICTFPVNVNDSSSAGSDSESDEISQYRIEFPNGKTIVSNDSE